MFVLLVFELLKIVGIGQLFQVIHPGFAFVGSQTDLMDSMPLPSNTYSLNYNMNEKKCTQNVDIMYWGFVANGRILLYSFVPLK